MKHPSTRASVVLLVLWMSQRPAGAAEMTLCIDVPGRFTGPTGPIEIQHYETFKTAGTGVYEVVTTLTALADDTNRAAMGIDAIDLLTGGEFLFSANAPFTVDPDGPGPLPLVTYSQADVVKYTPGAPPTYTLQLAASTLNFASVDAPVDVDALARDGSGYLLLSFDVPVKISTGVEFLPADVVRVIGTTIQDTPLFQGSAAGLGANVNTVAIEMSGGNPHLMFMEPLQVGAATFPPGTIVRYSVATGLTPVWWDPIYPAQASGAGLAYTAGAPPTGLPGPVPDGQVVPGTPLTIAKGSGSTIALTWGRSCVDPSAYGVYEGAIGSFPSHVPASNGVSTLCNVPDPGTGSTVTVVAQPASGDRYYILVPRNGSSEGSYGVMTGGASRPPSASPCVVPQLARTCP